MADRSRCLVNVRICLMSSSKQGEVPYMGMPGRSMDAYEQEAARVNVEILVRNTPCQDTAGNVGGSPTYWT